MLLQAHAPTSAFTSVIAIAFTSVINRMCRSNFLQDFTTFLSIKTCAYSYVTIIKKAVIHY